MYATENDLHLNQKFPSTLEGQIVMIADEIAQRGHDLDDAISSDKLRIEDLKNACANLHLSDIGEKLDFLIKEIRVSRSDRVISDTMDLVRARIVPLIIGHFIEDVISESMIRIERFCRQHDKIESFNEGGIIEEQLIYFSERGAVQLKDLEKLITKSVINSNEVRRADSKAVTIIESIFEAYYKDPRLLPKSIGVKLMEDLKRAETYCFDIHNDAPSFLLNKVFKPIHEIGNNDDEDQYEWLIVKDVLLTNIADYISGMTDNFAHTEYQHLFM
jgi:dGTPase